jgi:hypothetical protein
MTLLALLVALGVVVSAGCAPRKGGVLNVIPQGATYDVTYQYTLTTPPPSGQVYVFWLVNPDENKLVRIGTVQPGVNRVVKVQVDFLPTGAIVSPEPSDTVERPGQDWELMDGKVIK